MTSNPASVGPAPDGLRFQSPDFAPRSHAAHLEQHAYNQMPKGGWRDLQLFRYDGTDIYQWFGKRGLSSMARNWSVFEDSASDPFLIAPHPDREAEPTGGELARAEAVIREVDSAARMAASMNDAGYTVTVERTASHIYGITSAFLAGLPPLSVSPPVVEGSLQAQAPSVPTEGHEAAVVATSPLEIAYGCLWRTVTDNEKLRQARKLLSRSVDHDGQKRGVAWAVENLPPVSDAEIRSLDL